MVENLQALWEAFEVCVPLAWNESLFTHSTYIYTYVLLGKQGAPAPVFIGLFSEGNTENKYHKYPSMAH